MRLKRVDFVPEITESVYRRMEAERKRVANELRSTGAAEGEKIRADADRQREVIVAEPTATRRRSRARATPRPRRSTPRPSAANPQFAQFYRSLEAYRASFRKQSDVMVVDPSSEFFRYLQERRRRRRPAGADGRKRSDSRSALMLVLEGLLPFSRRPAGARCFSA